VINALYKIAGVIKVERIKGWQGPVGP
jgi:hypothetical protein